MAVEIGVDIYIRHLAHILGRIELGDIRALEKDMLYPRRRKQVFELAARHLLICALEHEHIMAALKFRDDIRRDIPVFAQGVPQYICHIMLAGKLQQLFKIAAEIIRTAAFEHGAHKKNIIFVNLFHFKPPLSAVKNDRSYLPDYFIILNDTEFSGKKASGIHQLVIIFRLECVRVTARPVDIAQTRLVVIVELLAVQICREIRIYHNRLNKKFIRDICVLKLPEHKRFLRDEIFCKLAGHAEPLRAALYFFSLYPVYPEYTTDNRFGLRDKAIKKVSSA